MNTLHSPPTFLRAAGVVAGPAAASTRLRPRARRAAAAAPRRAAWSASARRSACTRPYFFPEKAGQGLRAHAVPRSPQGLPRRLHGHLRPVAPGRRPEPRLQLQLPDRRPAPGAAGRVPEQHLARPVRGRAPRRPDALPQPAAVVRGVRPVVDPERRAGAGGRLAVERVRQAVPRRPARRGRRPRRAACADGQSILDAVRDQAKTLQAGARRRRPRQARRVLHQRPRAGAAAGAGRGVGEEAEAEGRRQAAAEHREPGRPHRQDAAVVRPHPPGAADRFDPAGHAATAGHEQRAADPGRDAGPPRPVAPRQGPGQDRAAQDARDREDEDPPRLPREAEGDEGRRRHACSTGRWCSSAATWATPAATASRTCRSCSPAAASSTASTWPSTRRTTRRCATST